MYVFPDSRFLLWREQKLIIFRQTGFWGWRGKQSSVDQSLYRSLGEWRRRHRTPGHWTANEENTKENCLLRVFRYRVSWSLVLHCCLAPQIASNFNSCSLFWKATAIVLGLCTIYYGFKAIRWALTVYFQSDAVYLFLLKKNHVSPSQLDWKICQLLALL